MNMRMALKAAVLLLTISGSVSSAYALETKMVLDLVTARIAADACFQFQQEKAFAPITVVIVDDGGNVIFRGRQDKACKACGDIADGKAKTAALFGMTTRLMEKLSFGEHKDGKDVDLPGAPFVPGIVAFPGGLPIKEGEAIIGGIGVSGASADEDEACAQAGISAVEGKVN
jgi:glc operon protein GlcG